MDVVLISTYELGHQPFGLASPAAWLRENNHNVKCIDLSAQFLNPDIIAKADFIAFYIPMHTATKLALKVLPKVKEINSKVIICFYGLYAPLNENYLKAMGADFVIGGEFEEPLVCIVNNLERGERHPIPTISLSKQKFLVPDRRALPALDNYAKLNTSNNGHLLVGYTEASRGCKHFCRHCPIVPVYNGVFRIVQKEVVIEDIRQQVSEGAKHITFGDPDFFNGPKHSFAIAEEFHKLFPEITYDVTIKIEHLLKYSEYIPYLKKTGCLFVTTAVESIDDRILRILNKGHTKEDFIKVVRLFKDADLTLSPTFVTFTPWTTLEGYKKLLEVIAELELIENISPVQMAIRLLITSNSKLLELNEVKEIIDTYNEKELVYPWKHPDIRVDELYIRTRNIVKDSHQSGNKFIIFEKIWNETTKLLKTRVPRQGGISKTQQAPLYISLTNKKPRQGGISKTQQIPSLSEAWYCCAEPTEEQFTYV